MANFLEQLVAEWYEYQGYFVRKNILVGKRAKGGHEGELDVVAFHPKNKQLIHIEPSMDADSWEKRERRYKKKFNAGKKYIPGLFEGIDIPTDIEHIALFGFIGKKHRRNLAGGKVVSIREFLKEIIDNIQSNKTATNIIPEQFSLLRTIMFMTEHKEFIFSEEEH